MAFEIALTLLLLLGAAFLSAALLRLRRRRLLSAGANGVVGALLVCAGLLLGSLALNLHTYHRLTYEQPVAELEFKRLGPQQFQVFLRQADGQAQLFGLLGDEWQLDARVLTWRGYANVLGLDAHYRLERIRGRYRDLERERTAPRSVYDLAPPAGLDLWALAERHGRWLPWVDAVYGSAAYLPMADGARFEVSLSQHGLVARPLNAAAQAAVRAWD